MTYLTDRDPNKQKVPSELNPMTHGPARNWYELAAGHLGAVELPVYARALRVRMSSAATVPLKIIGVPIGELTDANTQTLYVDATETLTFGFRRIVSLNDGNTIPTGVNISCVTT